MEETMQGQQEGAVNVGGGVSGPPQGGIQTGTTTMHPAAGMPPMPTEEPDDVTYDDMMPPTVSPANDEPTNAGHDHADKWDDNDIATLRRLNDEGMSIARIAAQMGRSPKAVGSKKYRLGLKSPK